MALSAPENLQRICKIIDDTVRSEKIYLFGSYAYGSPHADSDYDLCVVIPDGADRPLDAAVKIRKALAATQDGPIDIMVHQESRFRERAQGPTMERKIVREGVLLYERDSLEQRMA